LPRRSAEVRKVTAEQAAVITDTRQPLGLFYCLTAGAYIGIDNSGGHAWVEVFPDLRTCKRWLTDSSIPGPSLTDE
jgi:hypothetical protein